MKLAPSMTVTEFDNGYWYATDLKKFAHALSIKTASTLRKDQLEQAIRQFLRTGRVPPASRKARIAGERDVDLGLRLDRIVVRYTNDPETKAFLEREAEKLSPSYRRRSGARYRLNRWREDQLARARPITYRDLVKAYVRLSAPSAEYAPIPSTRYLRFLGDSCATSRMPRVPPRSARGTR